jgi:hypothetical protein
MVEGRWTGDLGERLAGKLSRVRYSVMPEPDTSRNTFRAVWDALAVSYVRKPVVRHVAEQANAETGLIAVMVKSGYWALMAGTGERDLYAYRDLPIRVDVTPSGELVHRIAYPDHVVTRPDPRVPHRAVRVEELVPRLGPTGEGVWVWEILDISDPAAPLYQLFDGEHKEDLTTEHLGAPQSGDAYPYRLADGTPILPYAFGHAERRSCMWGSWANNELYTGTLEIGCKWTYINHVEFNAAHPQRYGIGVAPSGTSLLDASGTGTQRRAVEADPAVLLMFEAAEGFEGQPTLSQFNPAADLPAMVAAAGVYERGVVAMAPGVVATDFQRMSGDPRSGYALALSREGTRETQLHQEPQLRLMDLEVLRISAALLNRHTGSSHPEEGYTIEYVSLPLSPKELQEQADYLLGLVDRNLLSITQAFQIMHRGASDEDAAMALSRNRVINDRFR